MKNKLILLLMIGCVLIFSMCTTAFIDEGDEPILDEEITYSKDIETIMFNHCVTCHGGSVPAADLNLQTFTNVKTAALNGTLLSRVEDSTNPMPPSGLLSAEDRAKISKWAEDGYKE